ncbi:MAG: Zonular occludens toxin [Deltaproteobacteria bacterium]|nr:Zonular occludens toxin [Deltaproteobacteria bacterium]
MITFYEGLPRSGKSFTVVRDEIIPALEKGRAVVAYIEGLNHEKIASLAGITLERCHELLIALRRDQAKDWNTLTPNDALVVLDEAQNFWPNRQKPLDEETTQAITEHGHRGLDIVLMGQFLKDVHALWKNRVERKLYFLKKTALGKPDEYSCTVSTAIPQGDKVVFEKVATYDYKYDPKYFGTYKSHEDGTANKETKVDPRVVIWNQPLFRKYLPVAFVVMCGLIYYVWGLFHGGLDKELVKGKASGSVPAAEVPRVIQTSAAVPAKDERLGLMSGVVPEEAPDMIQKLTAENRARLVGYAEFRGNRVGIIEWRDPGGAQVQSFTLKDIEGFGYSVFVNTAQTLAVLVKGQTRLVVSSWTIDKREGVATETQQRSVRGDPGPVAVPVDRGIVQG